MSQSAALKAAPDAETAPRLDAPYGAFKESLGLPPLVLAAINALSAAFLTALYIPLALVMALSDRVMMLSFGQYYIYNKSWEDPRVESELLQINEKDHVLTIASAGDNVLHYALCGARVTAVDLNECQLALTELKMVAAQHLSYDDFWALFGTCDGKHLRAAYPTLRPHLSETARSFWDRKAPHIGSMMYSGSSGLLAWFIFRVFLPLLGFGWLRRAVVADMPADEFRTLCRSKIWSLRFLCWFIDTVLVRFGAALAGVPAKQFNLMGDRDNSMAVVVHKILFETDFCRDNYFFSGYVRGFYTPESCPEYLKRENFDKLRRAIRAGKIVLKHQSIADACAQASSNNETFTVASLLDHMDWLEHVHINDELSLLFQAMEENGSIFYRTFSDTVHSPPLVWQEPERVDLAKLRDRVPMYFSAFVIHVSKDRSPQPRCESWQAALQAPNKVGHLSSHLVSHAFATTWVKKVQIGAQLVLFPIRKRIHELIAKFTPTMAHTQQAHAAAMEEFYASQAEAYDSFREQFLWARAGMLSSLPIDPLKAGEERVWIDIGGGTGRNLEFLPPHVLRRCFTKIVILDISASLLKVAAERVKSYNLDSLVECVCGDVNDVDFVRKSLPKQANIITFSYSLSMIPDKKNALQTARSLLAPHGVIAIADFFFDSENNNRSLLRSVEAQLQALWFKQDGVHLLRAHDVAPLFRQDSNVNQSKPLDCIWLERFRGSVPLLPILRPYHGILIAQHESQLIL